MAATFILSLDCEGKWGMADHLTADHHRWLTTARLRDAYARILALFAEHRIDATFAFVQAFLLSPAEQRDHDELFQDHEIEGRNWLAAFRHAQADGNMEGWSLPELLDMVQEHGGHEIGCHGFSHLPLAESMVTASVMNHELAAAATVAAAKKLTLETFVYPRNLVGHPAELGKHGYTGYRGRLPVPTGVLGRAANLLSEFNVAQRPQPQVPAQTGRIVTIPSGFFFNWRFGARRHVPEAVTAWRWTRMLDKAVAHDGVVHLWLHPHNIISAPSTFDVLARVLANVAQLRDRGLLEIETQSRYCTARMTH